MAEPPVWNGLHCAACLQIYRLMFYLQLRQRAAELLTLGPQAPDFANQIANHPNQVRRRQTFERLGSPVAIPSLNHIFETPRPEICSNYPSPRRETDGTNTGIRLGGRCAGGGRSIASLPIPRGCAVALRGDGGRVLALDPGVAGTRAVGRAEPLRDDSLGPEPAGMGEHFRAVRRDVLA